MGTVVVVLIGTVVVVLIGTVVVLIGTVVVVLIGTVVVLMGTVVVLIGTVVVVVIGMDVVGGTPMTGPPANPGSPPPPMIGSGPRAGWSAGSTSPADHSDTSGAAAFRAFGLTPSEAELEDYADDIAMAGDKPYFYGPPTGYPDEDQYWLTGSAMLACFAAADRIASREDVIDAAIDLAQITPSTPHVTMVQDLYWHLILGGNKGNTTFPNGTARWSTFAAASLHSLGAGSQRQQISAALYVLLCSPEFRRY